MKLKQTFKAPVGAVYNVEGTLILSAESKAPDLVRELAALRAKAAALAPGELREKVDAGLAAAEAEGKAARPCGAAIKAHLDGVASALDTATGVTDQASRLAKMVADLGQWAADLFA